MTTETPDGIKAIVSDRAIDRSVISGMPEPSSSNPTPPSYGESSIFWIGQYADAITGWGRGYRTRDQQLRNYITKEPIFASALGIICARNAGFSWKLDGPERTVNRLQDMLENANQGLGWLDLIVKTSIDLYTQDNGAFWEIVRAADSPTAAFLGVNHLDAARCQHTGNREAPVIYTDRENKPHLLKWYEVVTFSEMPVPVEGFYGLQYSALTRVLRKMQIAENIEVYDYEKTGGRHTRAIHIVQGITTQQLTDAMNSGRAQADNAGYTRYSNPIVVGAIDPKAGIGHDTINMVDMPENFDAETHFKHYINAIAMAFGSDYQEFAPLPGGGLGTGAQSEILHLKSRGKGPANFMKMITHAINFLIAPQNTVFKFDEQDLEAEKGDAEVRSIRAQTRAVRIASGEITPQAARQIANDAGDLSVELIEMMGEQDLTTDVTVTDEAQLRKPSTTPSPNASPAPNKPPGAEQSKPQRGNDMNYNGSQKNLIQRIFGNPYRD